MSKDVVEETLEYSVNSYYLKNINRRIGYILYRLSYGDTSDYMREVLVNELFTLLNLRERLVKQSIPAIREYSVSKEHVVSGIISQSYSRSVELHNLY